MQCLVVPSGPRYVVVPSGRVLADGRFCFVRSTIVVVEGGRGEGPSVLPILRWTTESREWFVYRCNLDPELQ